MTKACPFRWLLVRALLLTTALALAESGPDANLQQQFKSASIQFEKGFYSEAAVQLEALLPRASKSFEVHELLGLTYAAESLNTKALEHLEAAVRLMPDSAAARTNLAASLMRSGRGDEAAEELQKAIHLDPQAYSANHNLGEFYVQSGKVAEALPLLEAAQRAKPSSYNNSYDLALACLMTGKIDEARQTARAMAGQQDTAELHNLLGQIEEKSGNFVAAAGEYETAARMDPSEDNLFAWGSELLLHRTLDPAIDVFKQAAARYPSSARLMIGLGMALYSRGKYDESIHYLLKGADLDPADPRAYLFLSKAYDSSPDQAEDVIARFRRYADLQPSNGLAQYYYAMSLWKGKRAEGSALDLQKVEGLLHRSISLDDTSADAHLQLGILFSDRKEYAQSLPEYQRALELDPKMADAHYRLGQYYVHTGQKEHAQQEFDLYQKYRAEHLAAVDKERAAVQQFVYSAQAAPQKP